MSTKRLLRYAGGALMIGAVALAPLHAFAADAPAAPPPAPAPTTLAQATPEAAPMAAPVIQSTPATTPAAAAPRSIGGHVGVATPLVQVQNKTTTIADNFTVLNPIGIGFKLLPELVMDFEFVIATPVHPTGTTGIVVDPGVVYDMGAFALGLRVAWQVQADTNVGLIPLFHVPVVKGDVANWFVEAAFPTFVHSDTGSGKFAFNAVFHTGVGF
jgi:hypothetical protein